MNVRTSKDLDQFRTDFIKNFRRIAMNTTPGDAQFLRILVESSRATSGLEIGTATGYGAIVMGLGFERNKGHLTSIDIDAEMVATARTNVRKMKLQKTVAVVKGAALKVIPRLAGPFDLSLSTLGRRSIWPTFGQWNRSSRRGRSLWPTT